MTGEEGGGGGINRAASPAASLSPHCSSGQEIRKEPLSQTADFPDNDYQQRRAIMMYNFLSPPNRFKPREFKEFLGGLLTYSLP